MFALHEKDMQAKLKDLFKKSMFDLAINLAKSQQYDPDGLIDIFRQVAVYDYENCTTTRGVYDALEKVRC